MDPHQRWMEQALVLAEQGRGAVEPNPLVGALVVQDGQLVGTGWHEAYGGPHAEIRALEAAGAAAREATLYVTLEPCCHHGKTPPCTLAVLRAGIRRVVAALADPFPQVAGQGAVQLRAAGVEVVLGVGEAAARRQNAPYLKLLASGRPYVHAKWAMSLDGKIATSTGDSKWISNDASRRRVHALRGRMDAIIVGSGTVLADNPLLTARPAGPRTAQRIVLDRRLRTPVAAQLVRTTGEAPTLFVTGPDSDAKRAADLEAAGCTILRLPQQAGADAVTALLVELGRRRCTNVLVEGGAAVLGSFLDARAMDEVHVFVAPVLMGGAAAPTAVAGHGFSRIAEALRLGEWHWEQLEGDLYCTGRLAAS